MIRYSRIAVVISMAVILSACSTAPSKQDQGVVIGAVAGGLLGNQVGGGTGKVVATIAGAVIGGAIGGSVGKSMDETDRMKANAAFENGRSGTSSTWVNPDTGYEYVVTPNNSYETDSGPCREYTMDATIGGKTEQVYGTACRQPDGSWQVSN